MNQDTSSASASASAFSAGGSESSSNGPASHGDSAAATDSGRVQRRAPLKSSYLILGDDLPKIELALKRLKARIAEESGTELNIDEFDAAEHDGTEVVNAANTLAFLGGMRLVLVHGVQAWSSADKHTVAAYLHSPAPDSCLTLVAEKLTTSDVLRTTMEKYGDVLEYRAPKEGELPGWLVKQAKLMGLDLGLPEARMLVQRCGDNQSILLRELEKLRAYVAGDDQVRPEDVEALTVPTVEANIFDLLDALAMARGPEAFAALEKLMGAGESPEMLFYRILRNFQTLSKVAALRAEGYDRESIRSELKLKPYPARKLTEQAALLGSDGIGRRLSVLADTDARMKGMGTLSKDMELQLCVGRLLEQ